MTAPLPILIVDDKHLIRDIYRQAFTSAGYSVDLAATGAEALTSIETTTYAAILLDVMMPDMDGLSFITELGMHANGDAQGPIILLTNLSREAVEQLESEFKSHLGDGHKHIRIAGHIIKSDFTPEEIIKRVSALITTQN